MTIDLDVGVLLTSAVESSGTSTLASGKYAAAQPRGVVVGDHPEGLRAPLAVGATR